MVANVSGAFAQPGRLVNLFQAVELAFQPDQGVAGGQVGVAARLQEVRTLGELEPAQM